MNNAILGIVTAVTIMFSGQPVVPQNRVLTEANYSLTNRYSNTYVNDVFTDNILLTLAYMGGKVKKVRISLGMTWKNQAQIASS